MAGGTYTNAEGERLGLAPSCVRNPRSGNWSRKYYKNSISIEEAERRKYQKRTDQKGFTCYVYPKTSQKEYLPKTKVKPVIPPAEDVEIQADIKEETKKVEKEVFKQAEKKVEKSNKKIIQTAIEDISTQSKEIIENITDFGVREINKVVDDEINLRKGMVHEGDIGTLISRIQTMKEEIIAEAKEAVKNLQQDIIDKALAKIEKNTKEIFQNAFNNVNTEVNQIFNDYLGLELDLVETPDGEYYYEDADTEETIKLTKPTVDKLKELRKKEMKLLNKYRDIMTRQRELCNDIDFTEMENTVLKDYKDILTQQQMLCQNLQKYE